MSRSGLDELDGDWEHELIDLEKEQTYQEKYELMEKLLDSESTLFSKKMRDWLIKEDVLDILVRFVTRPPPMSKEEEEQCPVFEILKSDEYTQSSNRRRDALLATEAEKKAEADAKAEAGEENIVDEDEDEDFTFSKEAKRADKAAEVFVYQAASFPQDFIDKQLEHMVKQLFKVFHLRAEGDFDNFDKMFASLLGPYGTKVMSVFAKNRKLVLHLLNYLHDPAISETLSGVLKAMLPEQVIANFFAILNEDGFWSCLGEKIYGIGAEASYEDACAFFVRLVETCSTQTNADILFAELGRDLVFVEGLVSAIANVTGKTTHEQQVACITALRALLLKSGEQLFDSSLEAYAPTPVANMLSCVHEPLHNYLKTRAGALAQKLLDDAQPKKKQQLPQETSFSTYSVGSRFTVSRIHLLEVLVALAEQNPNEVLDSFPPGIWRVLSDWLFEHKFNNIYHDLFYKLFRTMVKTNHVDSLKSLLSRYKFLQRMTEHYRASTFFDSGLKSFILLMANLLRFKADTQPPTEILKNFLNSTPVWKEFLPLLRADTINQMVTEYPAPAGSHPIPINPFASSESFGIYAPTVPTKPITPADVNIELGSDYARKLGFEETGPYTAESKKKKRKKRKKGKGKAPEASGNESDNAKASTSGSTSGSTNDASPRPATEEGKAKETQVQGAKPAEAKKEDKPAAETSGANSTQPVSNHVG